MSEKERKLGIWGKFLTLWVALCIGAGILLGRFFPQVSDILAKLEHMTDREGLAPLLGTASMEEVPD